MCTREETRQEIELSERRIESKLEHCRNEVDTQIYRSYNSVAQVQSEMGATLKTLTNRIEEFGKRFYEHDKKEIEYQNKVDAHLELQSSFSKLTSDDVQALKDIAQGYAGMSAMRKLILGLASTIIAIGAVVAGFITLIKSIK